MQRLLVVSHIEGWMSGLNHQFAKLTGQVAPGPVGSNPTPSAKKNINLNYNGQ